MPEDKTHFSLCSSHPYAPRSNSSPNPMEHNTTPQLEPSDVDLLVIGTGLPESLCAACAQYHSPLLVLSPRPTLRHCSFLFHDGTRYSAASQSGSRVLHVDPASVYGGSYAGITASHARDFLLYQCNHNQPQPHNTSPNEQQRDTCKSFYLNSSHLHYANAEEVGQFDSIAPSARRIIVELSGPTIPYCDDPLIHCLLHSGAHCYCEFKPIERSLLFEHPGSPASDVPSTRQGIFRNTSLSLRDKRELTRYISSLMKHVRSHLFSFLEPIFVAVYIVITSSLQEESNEGRGEGSGLQEYSNNASSMQQFNDHTRHTSTSSARSLEQALQEQSIKRELRHKLCFGLALGKDSSLSEREGFARIRRYVRSTGRYGHGQEAFLAPLYGLGDLAQGFCRSAAVRGAIHCLNCGLKSISPTDTSNCSRKVHLETDTGQLLQCDGVVCSSLAAPYDLHCQRRAEGEWIARAAILLDRSAFGQSSQAVAAFAPHSLEGDNAYAVRALQLSPGVGVCPDSMYLLHLATKSTGESARSQLEPAVSALLEHHGAPEAQVLWGVYYESFSHEQTLSEAAFASDVGGFAIVPSPGESPGTVDDVHFAKQALAIAQPRADFLATESAELPEQEAQESEAEWKEDIHAFDHLARAINRSSAGSESH